MSVDSSRISLSITDYLGSLIRRFHKLNSNGTKLMFCTWILLTLFFLIGMKSIQHKINHLKMCNSVPFHRFSELCYHGRFLTHKVLYFYIGFADVFSVVSLCCFVTGVSLLLFWVWVGFCFCFVLPLPPCLDSCAGGSL